MKTILIYLKSSKKPFEITFESKTKLEKFYAELQIQDIGIITVGPLSFARNEFLYCLQK